MKNTKLLRVIVFAVVLVMLASMLPVYAAEGEAVTIVADDTINIGGVKSATLSRDDPYYILKFTVAATADYAIWSEADSTCDPYLELLDSEGYIINYDDDRSFDYNFKLIQELDPGDYYIKVTNYDKARKVSFPVSVAKAVDPKNIEVSLWYDSIPVGTSNFVSVKYLPGNSYEPDIVLSSSDSSVARIDYDEIRGVKPGETIITATVDGTSIADNITLAVTGEELQTNAPKSGEVSYANNLAAYYFKAGDKGAAYSFIVEAENEVRLVAVGEKETDEKRTKNGVVSINLNANEVCAVLVEMTDLPSDYTVFVKKSSRPTSVNIETESGKTVYTAGDTDRYVMVYDDVAAVPSSVEVSSSDSSIVKVTDYGEFTCLKAGTATITAKTQSPTKTVSMTVTVKNPPEITLSKSYTSTLNGDSDGESDKSHVYFKVPSAGSYQFDVTNNKNIVFSVLSFDPHYMIGENSIQLVDLKAGDEVIVEYTPNAKYFKDAVSTTVSVKKLSAAGSTVIAEGSTFAGSVGQTIVLNSGGFYNQVSWSGADSKLSASKLSNDGASVYLRSEGASSVELKTEHGTKKITVNIAAAKRLKENVTSTSKFNKNLQIDSYIFAPDISGFYNFNINSTGYSYVSVERTFDDKWVASGDARGDHTVGGYLEAGYEYEVTVESEYPSAYDCAITVKHMPYAASAFSPAGNMTAYVGEEFTAEELDIRFAPIGSVSERVTKVSSSNEAIASTKGLSDNNVLRAQKQGTATVFIETEYGLTTSFNINIVGNDYVPADGISLNINELTLKTGESSKLSATVAPAGNKNRVYWGSSNSNIVAVDVNGNITALKSGTAVIYARCDNNIAECTVTVPMIGLKDTTKIFKDVEAGRWYIDAVNYTYSNGFIAGIEKDVFGVNTEVTRGMFITVLARIAGVDTSDAANMQSTRFTDVARGRYYTAAIKWASESGVVAGITTTTFAPDKPIERQQLCVMIVNFAINQNVSMRTMEAEIAFADHGSIGNYAKRAVATCQTSDIVNGYSEGGKVYFKPQNTASRAEAAQILYKFHKEFMIG